MLLSQKEKECLLGNAKLSKGHELKIKSIVMKKIENFQKNELPLLMKKNLLDLQDVTKFSNSVTNYSNDANRLLRFDSYIINNFQSEFNKNFNIIDKIMEILVGRT